MHAGKDGHESAVRVVSKRRCPVDDMPFPLEKMKHILRRATEDEITVFNQERRSKGKKITKKFVKEAYNGEPYTSEGVQRDGSIIICHEDYGVDSFDGMDYEITYELNPENTKKRQEYLSAKYTGGIEYMIIQECGLGYRKKALTELFEEAGVEFSHFSWIS